MIVRKGGKLVSRLREMSGMSQQELALKVGISQPYLSNIENKERLNLTVDVLEKLAITLGFTPAEYFEGKKV